MLHGTPTGQHVRLYSPPFEEFELAAVTVPAGDSAVLAPTPGPQLLLVQRGGGTAAATRGSGGLRV